MRIISNLYNVAHVCSPNDALADAVVHETGLAVQLLNKMRGAYIAANGSSWTPDNHDTYSTDVVLAGGALRSWFLEGVAANDLDFWVQVPPVYVNTRADGVMELRGTFYGDFMSCFGSAELQVLGDNAYDGHGLLRVVQVTLEGHPPVQIIFYSRAGGLQELLREFPDNLSKQAMLYSTAGPMIAALKTSMLWQVYYGSRTKYLRYVFEPADDMTRQIERSRKIVQLYAKSIVPRYSDPAWDTFSPDVQMTVPTSSVRDIIKEVKCRVVMF